MKELSIEQKAKRYDEALERVKELLSRCRNNRDRITMVYRVNDIESIFSELKKSEDEKIKEDLIEWISDFPDMIWSGHYKKDVIAWLEKQGNKDSQIKLPTFTFDDILALQCCMETVKKVQNDKDLYEKLNDLHGRIYDAYYLEKQGEQKQDVNVQINPSEYVNDMGGNGCYLKNTTQTSTWSKKEEKVDNQKCVKSVDDIKPKFKVGDWIVFDNGNVEHIISVGTHGYTFDDGDYLLHDKCDKDAHLWTTIQDAKDGDVLTSGNFIFIFNMIHGVWVNCHCSLHKDGSFNDGNYDLMHIKYAKEVYPATKEQRDTLFAKMKEAKWEWDAEKKELWC